MLPETYEVERDGELVMVNRAMLTEAERATIITRLEHEARCLNAETLRLVREGSLDGDRLLAWYEAAANAANQEAGELAEFRRRRHLPRLVKGAVSH